MPFNGTGFTHNYSGSSTDIVGYAWNADLWCPRCTLEALGYATTGPVVGGSASLESAIRVYAEENGLDPRTTDVPQPIFNGEDAVDIDGDGRAHRCCKCHEPLIEVDENTEE